MSDIKTLITKIIAIVVVIAVCFILQVSVFSHFPLAGVTPNILVCAVATYGFMKGQKTGLIIGFFTGLLLDLYSGFLFGFYALIYMYIGFLNGFFKKLFFGDELRLPLVLIGTSDFIFGLATYLALYFTRLQNEFNFYLMNIIFPELIYTVVVSIFIYYVILSVNNMMDKLEKKGSDRIGTY